MHVKYEVAKCPYCQAIIPLDSAGVWVEHTSYYKHIASYTCPGTGVSPEEGEVQVISCTNE